VTFGDSLPVLKGWYDECIYSSHHHRCTSESQPLPTRLLFVGPATNPVLQLVVPPAGQAGIYAALSHCWGTSQHAARTTKANLHDAQKEITMSRLPKTFLDAVCVVRELGLEYLWIDSLCIIQDDEEDWQRESAAMANVFSNAHVTLAATASQDSEGGCLFDREPAKHVVTSADASKAVYIRYPAEERKSLLQSPLYQRGWVLQEMVLSRRTVHFAQDQLFWHCCSRLTSEDGFFDAALGVTYSDLQSPQKAHESWWTWIEDYSMRQLTRSNDKFAALAGLTKAFPHGGKPLAGLWLDDIHFGILWCAREGSARAEMPHIPSWSWASVDGPVRAISARDTPVWKDHSHTLTTHQMRVVDSTVEWSGEMLASDIRHASLRVEAKVALVVTAVEADQDYPTRQYVGMYRFLNYRRFAKLFHLLPLITDFDNNSPGYSHGHGCFDVTSETPEPGSRVLCLLVSTSSHCGYTCRVGYDEHESLNTNCEHLLHNVLLIETTGQPDEFRRIGLGTIRARQDEPDFFSDVDTMELTLV